MKYLKLYEEYNETNFLKLKSKTPVKKSTIFIGDDVAEIESYELVFENVNGACIRTTYQSYFYSVIDDIYKPFKYLEIARIDAPRDEDSFMKRKERQGYGTIMFNELLDYCKNNNIDYIGSCTLNEKSRGLFEKFEKNGIIEPTENGLNRKTILWKILKSF
jgi:hypothetical protein